MKRTKHIAIAFFVAAALLISSSVKLSSKIVGPPAGSTGDPFTGVTCTQSGCHVGTTQIHTMFMSTLKLGTLGTSMPTVTGSTQYVPGTTYDASFSLVSSNSRFGFQICSLDSTGAQAGTFAVTNAANTAITTLAGRQYMGHKNASATKIWNFSWTAPATNQGPVTFYYTFNLSNGDGIANASDLIYKGQVTIQPAGVQPLAVNLGGGGITCRGTVDTLSPTATNGVGPYTYAWSSTGDTLSCNSCQNPAVTITQSSTYTVTVTDATSATASAQVAYTTGSTFSGQQICMVSVDWATGKNLVIWDKTSGNGIDSFKIYRETSIANQYELIGAQPFSSFSTFLDLLSNPQTVSSRYGITTVDACGESARSTVTHKTIHLTSNMGINNEVNLIWSAYEGVNYSTFSIYRGASRATMSLLAQVPAGTLSYTDVSPLSPPAFYQIEIINPQNCNPTAKTESYNSSLSNIIQIAVQGVNDVQNGTAGKIYWYYDENNGQNMVRWVSGNVTPGFLTVYDLQGKKMYETGSVTNKPLALPQQLAKGIYVAEVTSNHRAVHSRIFVQ